MEETSALTAPPWTVLSRRLALKYIIAAQPNGTADGKLSLAQPLTSAVASTPSVAGSFILLPLCSPRHRMRECHPCTPEGSWSASGELRGTATRRLHHSDRRGSASIEMSAAPESLTAQFSTASVAGCSSRTNGGASEREREREPSGRRMGLRAEMRVHELRRLRIQRSSLRLCDRHMRHAITGELHCRDARAGATEGVRMGGVPHAEPSFPSDKHAGGCLSAQNNNNGLATSCWVSEAKEGSGAGRLSLLFFLSPHRPVWMDFVSADGTENPTCGRIEDLRAAIRQLRMTNQEITIHVKI